MPEALGRYSTSSRGGSDPEFFVTLFGVHARFPAGARMQQRFPGMPAASGSATGVKRSVVGSLSWASRRRLREAIWSVQPALLPRRVDGRLVWPASFLTTTYPVEDLERHMQDPRLHKRHLDVFTKALQRYSFGSWFVWVLEHQKNGSLHFHFLVRWGVLPRWKRCQDWLSETWATIAADGWVFRRKWNTESGGSGTAIPEEVEQRIREVEHGIRRKWNIDSGGSGTAVPEVVNARR